MCPLLRAEPSAVEPSERLVDAALLRSMPLPALDGDATKRARGTALIIGGSAETPGGTLLAACAALRMGAGKVRIATVESVAAALAVAVPEARVLALPETDDGAIARFAASKLATALAQADAVLVGTSTLDSEETGALLTAIVPLVHESSTVVIDAGAIPVLREEPRLLRPIAGRSTVIPNPSEMSMLLSAPEDEVCNRPRAAVDEAVSRLGSVVALRDAVTRTSSPAREHFVDQTGHAALGTAGSGDVLAGALAGLAARGADPLRATLWAMHVHGLAGEHLGRHGPGIGTLARELLDVLPAMVHSISAGAAR
jgi:ADP-dependent NAD(P)H-hydrate dehydratase